MPSVSIRTVAYLACITTFALLTACSASRGEDMIDPFGSGSSDDGGDGGDGGGDGDGGDDGSDGDDGYKFDIAGGEGDGGGDGDGGGSCIVTDGMDAVGDCDEQAPPNSFTPDVQWTWTGPGSANNSALTPLVANLTDDDGNGSIDLCDIPDIVVVVYARQDDPANLVVLDGATGAEHYTIGEAVRYGATPALGDMDGDGLPEIVSVSQQWRILVHENDGSLAHIGAEIPGINYHSIALADVDADGDVEIAVAGTLLDHRGQLLWTAPDSAPAFGGATAIADLDGDGLQEIIVGRSAYRADGSQYYLHASIGHGFPQVANLDDDPQPEVLLANQDGITILEHDGSVKLTGRTPTGDDPSLLNWYRPAAIHDFDGDTVSEFAMSSSGHYSVFERDASVLWTAAVLDETGAAAGTAFDFLGDGSAEAMYGDETKLFVYDRTGSPLLTNPRTSITLTEYPVVADVDNDGSAEIVLVSNAGFEYPEQVNPPWETVKVVRDVDDRWIQARRIWNQHTYHVANVREDGTIPQHEPRSWELLNTYRTNAQIEGGDVCRPRPEG